MARSRHPVRLFCKPPPPELSSRYLQVFDSRLLLQDPTQFPRFSESAFFGRESEGLDIDIGCATGDFIIELARRNPGRRFIGIDQMSKPLFRAVTDAAEAGLENIRFVKADFRLTIPLLDHHSIRTLYFHFPHPYVHWRRRETGIFTAHFLKTIHPMMRTVGMINILTDSGITWEHMMKCIDDAAVFSAKTEGPFRLEIDEGLKSFHHRKWEGQGRKIWRAELYPDWF